MRRHRLIWVLIFPSLIACNNGDLAAVQEDTTLAFRRLSDADTPAITDVRLPPSTFEAMDGLNIALFLGKRWMVVRHHPSGMVGLRYRDNDASEFVDQGIPRAWRLRYFPMLHLEADNDELYMVVYDVVKNSPSGRTLEDTREGFDVYRARHSSQYGPEPIASDVQLGGIDTTLYGALDGEYIYLCGDSRCVTVNVSNASVSNWNLADLSSYEFVEVVFHKERRNTIAAAIIRKRHDDRSNGAITSEYATYFLALFDDYGLRGIEAVPDGGIPWGLEWRENHPVYRLADSLWEFRNLFYYDFNRMRHDGIIDYGANNLEGRIAWSQAYYLHGLLSVLDGQLSALGPNNRKTLEQRILFETLLICQLCEEEYPGFRVKRYSLEQEPLLFALHLGRVAGLLARAKRVVGLHDANECLGKLESELKDLTQTVEQVVTVGAGDGFYFLQYRKGAPFWADGANVPYNYMSGYIEGLLSIDPTSSERAKRMLTPLLENEFRDKRPKLWRYWWGVGDEGWRASDQVSVNTPTYEGNKGSMAHITYRTMDAKAVLAFDSLSPGTIEEELIHHLRELTREGWLLPDMNEYWSRGDKAVRLSEAVTRRYARSAAVWELRSQPWALQALSEGGTQ
jgi:hypothetical protein